MSELFLQISVSLDGFIEDRDGDIEWMVNDPSLDARATATLQEIDGMIFGRKAHALLARFWPTAGQREDASPELVAQARLMNTLPKYVLTHGDERTGWANSHTVTADDVPGLKRDAQKPLAVFAGASAARALLDAGLVDEIRLIQYPILLGSGTPLFVDTGTRRQLHRISTEEFTSGAALQVYRLAPAERRKAGTIRHRRP